MANLATFGTENMTVPSGGPKIVAGRFDFRNGPQDVFDIELLASNGTFKFFQGAYFDNWLGGQPVDVLCEGTGQVIHVPSRCTLYTPILAQSGDRLMGTVAGAGIIVPVFLYNVPVMPLLVLNPD